MRVTRRDNFVYLALFRACQNYYLVSREVFGAVPGHVQTSGKRPEARQRRRIFAVVCEKEREREREKSETVDVLRINASSTQRANIHCPRLISIETFDGGKT